MMKESSLSQATVPPRRISSRDAEVLAALPEAEAVWRAKGGRDSDSRAGDAVDDAFWIATDIPVGPHLISWALTYLRQRGMYYFAQIDGRLLLARWGRDGVTTRELPSPDAQGKFSLAGNVFWKGRQIK